MKQSNQLNKGFTLIELLMVISIIGLLSSIALVSARSAQQKAREARRRQDISQLTIALELYYSTNGHYPDCQGIWLGQAVSYDCMTADLIAEGLLAYAPQDPLQYSDPTHVYWYDNWCNVPFTRTNNGYDDDNQYRLVAWTETPQPDSAALWWGDYNVGSTTCIDPS